MAATQPLRATSAFAGMLTRFALPATFSSPLQTSLSAIRLGSGPLPVIPALAIAIPSAIQTIPSILGDIWEGILKAVPKSKTSHMKKRHRQMAGKALKDVTNLNKCPACGGIKKMHTLCPTCLSRIQTELAKK
ncbi:uncharacterized protein B0I36DRAFT_259109 [Microdochium trichocladiopsis]|uniref:Large ribosomal subunit protein bL32m n=1 Tax=Microdochium trichocladiopsis TaxID=1682393 RepID=A0A9P9BTH0_9PEZI|nr:uncharacterized protein B0I36DRAFT_259109 [Microdochium trichocladiopsis]KAH7039971.1 hypothetical protein B0I36DRAFT_259109 [Microdochium trichocladiopsis]